MSEEATQDEGVSEPEETQVSADPSQSEESTEQRLGPVQERQAKRDALNKKRKEEIEDGLANAADHRLVDPAAYGGSEEPTEEGSEQQTEESDAAEPAAIDEGSGEADAPGDTEEATEDPDGLPNKLTLKVGGKLVTLVGDQVRSALQKDLYGDAKLQEAAEIRKALEDRERELEARERELGEREQLSEDAVDPLEVTTAAFNKLLDGNVEDAAKLLTDVTTKGRTETASTPRAEDLVEQAATRVMETLAADNFEEDMRAGWEEFKEEYPVIADDDVLRGATDIIITRIHQEHPDWKPSKIIMEAGKEMNDKYVNPSPPPPASEDQSRVDAKRNLKPIPQGQGSARHEEQKEPELDTSPHAAIERMRKSRAVSN